MGQAETLLISDHPWPPTSSAASLSQAAWSNPFPGPKADGTIHETEQAALGQLDAIPPSQHIVKKDQSLSEEKQRQNCSSLRQHS